MNIFQQWAKKWGVPREALDELADSLAPPPGRQSVDDGETAVMMRAELGASKSGGRLWRNNVGATYSKDGRFLRYGLANDSKQMNKNLKSSDLIGITPVEITCAHVGRVIGQFTAVECKHPGWKYHDTDREKAQLNFIKLVLSRGGKAYFENGGK